MPGPTEAQVLAVRQYFANIGLWKRRFELDPQGWLENFDEADRDLAVALLDGFVYLESRMLRKLFHIGLLDWSRIDRGTRGSPPKGHLPGMNS